MQSSVRAALGAVLPALALVISLAAPATTLAQADPSRVGSHPQFIGRAGDEVALFLANPGNNHPQPCLWRTDGTAAGTFRFPDCYTPSDNASYVTLADRFYFTSSSFFPSRLQPPQVVTTDGSLAGTGPVSAFQFGTLQTWNLGVAPDLERVIMVGDDGVHGSEPWITDGTVAGTGLLLDLEPGAEGSAPFSFIPIGDQIVFFRLDEAETPQLWVSDLTAAGTRRIAAFTPDGQLHTFNGIANLGDVVVFYVLRSGFEIDLWRTDGSEGGTYVLGTFELSPTGDGWSLRSTGGHVYFQADGGDGAGFEVWRSDGSSVERVTSFPQTPVTTHFFPRQVGDAVFMLLDGGPEVGRELYRSLGTPQTTTLVKDVCPGACSGYADIVVTTAETDSLGTLLLIQGRDPVHGREPWVSDGTPAGTRLLADLCPGACDSIYTAMRPLGDDWLVWANDGSHGVQLWALALEGGNHRRLTDFMVPGPGSVSSWRLGDRVLFSADDGVRGSEPWITDGTAAGTRLLVELAPQPGPVTQLPARPQPPTGLALEGEAVAIAGGNVTLQWNASAEAGRPEEFVIEMRSPRTEGWTVLATQPGAAYGRFEWIGELDPDTPHTFRVRARNQAGLSPPSAELSLRTRGAAATTDCDPDESLCLGGGRFRVDVDWRNHHVSPSESGVGHPVAAAGSDRSGYFWFFRPDNLELIVKILDGTPVNGHRWAFYGALSDVEYWVTVSDLETGEVTTYRNSPGDICGRGDTSAFRSRPEPSSVDLEAGASSTSLRSFSLPAATAPAAVSGGSHPTTPCVEDATTLCLLGGRYAVTVTWDDQHNDRSGVGGALPYADRTGFFWFFRPDNVELVVKVLDGTPVNGKTWVFYGALTDVGYTLTVTDTATGHGVEQYVNAPGNICGGADTEAF